MKSKTLITRLNDWEKDGILNTSDKDFLIEKSKTYARSVAGTKHGFPPKDSYALPASMHQSKIRNYFRAYERVLSQQLQWRHDVLRSGQIIIVYGQGKNKDRKIALN